MLWRGFQRLLNQYPLATQCVTSGVIAGSGDAICQLGVERRRVSDYDWARTGRFFFLSGAFIAPCLSRWFIVLERIRKGNPKLVPLKRVVVDQLTWSPVFNAAILFNLRLLEGEGVQSSYDQMKRDWWPVWSSSLLLWPAVQLANFYLVPLNMRVIVIQLVALFWNSYLSFKTQKKVDDK